MLALFLLVLLAEAADADPPASPQLRGATADALDPPLPPV